MIDAIAQHGGFPSGGEAFEALNMSSFLGPIWNHQ
jgi:hypothetical protein